VNIKQHLDLLGLKVQDKVTGFKGVVSSISFDLYGCVQAIVTPETDTIGKLLDQGWFDVSRLTVLDQRPVMQPPNFDFGETAEGKHGPTQKPQPDRPPNQPVIRKP
jgi:hypothetical protein